jgi:hypothetical protein
MQFVDDGFAEIRVTFNPRGGHWSKLGTDSQVDQSLPSMNFDPCDIFTEENWQIATLHEFGHVLGAIHKHMSPRAGIRGDRERVLQHYRTMGWPDAWTESNVFQAANIGST